MKKIISLSIPIAIIVLFNLIMISGTYLKQPFGEKDDVLAILEDIKKDINDEDWDSANAGAFRLETAWNIITGRVQFSTERDELVEGKTSIESMKGYIEANDKAGSFAEIYEIAEHWSEIGE